MSRGIDTATRLRGALPLIAIAVAGLAGCHRSGESADEAKSSKAPGGGGVPVRVAAVTQVDLTATVSGPGRVVALAQQKVRAPFTGTLTDLNVVDGDGVARGQVVGTIVA